MNQAPTNSDSSMSKPDICPQLIDQNQRGLALDPSQSFIVQAPAGSGKTGLLVRRYLALLAIVEIPEDILAITFTRKATAEMAKRIVSALAMANENENPATDEQEIWLLANSALKRDKERGWNLLKNPARLRIKTIDSLCYELVCSMPWSSRFGAAPEILDTDQSREFYGEAARKTLDQIEERNQNAQYISTILKLVNVQFSRAQKLLAQMLEKRDLWLRGINIHSRDNIESMWMSAVESELAGNLDTIPDYLKDDIKFLSTYAASNLLESGKEHPIRQCLDCADLFQGNSESLGCWKGITRMLLTNNGGKPKLRKIVNVNDGFPPTGKDEKARMKELLGEIAEKSDLVDAFSKISVLPEPGFSDEQWHALEALLHILPMAAAELKLLFSENNVADYTEITQRADMALGTEGAPTDLALMMDYRLSHLLMDEVQDTSRAHLDIISGLTRGWITGDGRTLFLVGDPMQSIYRFREADVVNFLKIKDNGIGEIKLQSLVLETNFRSAKTLVDWFNDTFRQIFPQKNDLIHAAVKYATSTGIRPPTIYPPVSIHGIEDGDDAKLATVLVNHITKTLGHFPDYSLGVLARSRKHLATIARELRTQGIAFQAVELEALDTRPVIQDLMALTRALTHPADRIAWLAVLRGPWCGLELPDLTRLTGNSPQTPVRALIQKALVDRTLTDSGHQRLTKLMERLSGPITRQGRITVRDNVQSAWIRLGGPACAAADELTDCEAYFELLDTLEKNVGTITHGNLGKAVEKLWSQTGAPARVQLMTIHKSKGLEFDAVFLPHLDKWSGVNDTELLNWARLGEDNLLVATLSPGDDDEDRFNKYLRSLEKLRQSHEDCRLLYVACTRARHQLGLYANLAKGDDGEIRRPDSRTLLNLLWPVLGNDFIDNLYTAEVAATEASQNDQPEWMQRIPTDWQPLTIPGKLQDIVSASSPSKDNTESIEFSWASETLRIAGIAIHRLLEHIHTNWSQWKVTDSENLLAHSHAVLAENGLSGTQLVEARETVLSALNNIKNDPRADWIFSPAHDQIRTEWALSAAIDNQNYNVIIDRSFVDETGTRWIIDFKSSRHEDENLTQFLEHEKQRYFQTMRNYARVVGLMGPEPIRLGLYFPLLKAWIEWNQ